VTPWVAALEGWAVLFYWSASGLFLFEMYTYWSRGFPWYLADMFNTQDLGNSLLYFVLETACWAAVVCVAWTYWKRMSRIGELPENGRSDGGDVASVSRGEVTSPH
jgi:hypothetical protein